MARPICAGQGWEEAREVTDTATLTVSELQARVDAARSRLDRDVGAAQAVARRGREAAVRAAEAKELEAAAEEAGRLLAKFSDERQERVVSAIESIASAGITSVFGTEMALHLRQTVRARRVEIDVTVSSDGLETSVLEARGGGLAAVVAFLLRVTVLLLTNDARRLIVADESFAHLSAEYAPRMATFLREMCERTDTQCILVTHDESFVEAADVVVRMVGSGDGTAAEVVKS